MGEVSSGVDQVAILPASEFTPDGSQAEAADGDGVSVIDNETLLAAIVQTRKIAKDLQHRSIDDHDPTLALRAHEVRRIGSSILERLLLAQGGQEALDELNASERIMPPSGNTAVYPHH